MDDKKFEFTSGLTLTEFRIRVGFLRRALNLVMKDDKPTPQEPEDQERKTKEALESLLVRGFTVEINVNPSPRSHDENIIELKGERKWKPVEFKEIVKLADLYGTRWSVTVTQPSR